jgi:hypothetical protein
MCIARQRVYTCDADHAARVLRHTFTAEKAFAGRALDRRFAQGVIGAALV